MQDEVDIDDICGLPPELQPRPVFERVGKRISSEERTWIMQQVCERLGQGLEDRKSIYGDLKITRRVIREWVKGDAEFAMKLVEAEELYREAMAEELPHLHEQHVNPAMAKVQSDNVKWLLGVQDRNRYGAKVEVTDTGNQQLVDVLKAAIARIPRPALPPSRNLPLIEDREAVDILELTALPNDA